MNFEPAEKLEADGEPGWFRGTRRTQFVEVYREEKPRLMRYFLRKLGNKADADEMAQETLARFLKSAPSTIASPRGYLTRIANNLIKDRACRNSTRLAQRSVPLDDSIGKPSQLDLQREAEARQSVERWRGILRQLAPDTLEIFVLNRVEGYSYREIAENLGLPLWQVQKHMLKAIRHVSANRSERDE